MIRIYPYPFSKYVKSLPDPPPGKSREIKNFECKKYKDDYSWLLKARSNLKKCFHLCDICSKKFNYMRSLVKNSNVQYEYNLSYNTARSNPKGEKEDVGEHMSIAHLCGNHKSFKHNNELCDVKNNILKINSNTSKNNVDSNQSITSLKSANDNSIIFSNSLNHNKTACLSFNDDVFIFLDDYPGKHSNRYEEDDEKCDALLQNVNSLKDDEIMCPQFQFDDTIIHIKRHFKNNVSYFACKHVKMNDLSNLDDENAKYDSINIYMCDNSMESFSKNDCVLNSSEEKEPFNLTQPIIITRFNEKDEKKEQSQKLDDLKNVSNDNHRYESLKRHDLNEDIEGIDLNLEPNGNCELFNVSLFCVNQEFAALYASGQADKNSKSYTKSERMGKINNNSIEKQDKMENLNKSGEQYAHRIDDNCKNDNIIQKHAFKRINTYTNLLNKEKKTRTLIDELQEKLMKRKNLYLGSQSEQNNNRSSDTTQEEKKQVMAEKCIQYLAANSNTVCSKGTQGNSILPMEGNLSALSIYKRQNVSEKKTINNVNIDEFKSRLANGGNLILNIEGGSSKGLKSMYSEAKNVKGKWTYSDDKEYEKHVYNRDVGHVKQDVNVIKARNQSGCGMSSSVKSHKGLKDNVDKNNYDIEIKMFTIDDKEKSSNLKLLEQIKSCNLVEENKEEGIRFKGGYTNFDQERIEDICEKNKSRNVPANERLRVTTTEKSKKPYKSKIIAGREEKTYFINSNSKKIEVNSDNENTFNSKDICKQSKNANGMNEKNVIKKSLEGDEREKGNIIYGEKNSDKQSSDKRSGHESSTFSRHDIFTSLTQNCKPGLKNELKDTSRSSKRENCNRSGDNLPISKEQENGSSNMWSKDMFISTESNTILGNNVNSNKDNLMKLTKIKGYYMKDKIHMNQSKGEPTEEGGESQEEKHTTGDRPKEADKLEHFKKKNGEEYSSDGTAILGRKTKNYGERKKPSQTNKNESEERLTTELKKKLSNILNSCTNPNKINIHNKIYASEMEKIKMDNNKMAYINNNYFFNVDKGNHFENCEKQVPKNSSMKYNCKNMDLQFCKSKNDFYSFNYMSNVLSSSSCSVSKEYIFRGSYESNILDEKINKLNELRKKYLLKKYLNAVLSRSKNHFVDSRRSKKVCNMDVPKLAYNAAKNKIDEKTNPKKEPLGGDVHFKQRSNEKFKTCKRDTKLCQAPQSPKKQDKIPKPLASQLETNSVSPLEKTQSYPFEDFNL
ncbi:conserved Plasmodium protein, unknown function [Plasmodium knowlesi strain H]|uniref:Uncharacterized protein n=3 Tax=Plasmodium knowlesi TaxID=5850 RepID=A0A5K1TTW5_PLAKH|nr:conserved Plasmodium protein, unknown function [Plasmodium knowlesi strain H]OTN68725.1 Uncharacterized protein PKNOH_S01022300 [Plasmodium knowlesi]CAA9986220.1 conserved Plasmodium protein, unknown function [Plasmodium knowlesi strain H]SBO25429.1 conserved Plasmodium protein, unknown function [Plasmodium knowlesi strain H]SBO27711.1 conserved Plasmodium protein, unknown function [Plasmodium knowlesi strain H]VVS75694.1 conserved Plasmodium protein, unknown function [Plasmodium knowlesi s|eukprot:XP_002257629.1 hypothetical protein, conserved in Plasmodium species [Plasmodium knowlesi strain H]